MGNEAERNQVPVLLGEVLDDLQHSTICHQVQRTLALVVGVVNVGAFLRQEAGDGSAHAQLCVPQQPRTTQLGRGGGGGKSYTQN